MKNSKFPSKTIGKIMKIIENIDICYNNICVTETFDTISGRLISIIICFKYDKSCIVLACNSIIPYNVHTCLFDDLLLHKPAVSKWNNKLFTPQ